MRRGGKYLCVWDRRRAKGYPDGQSLLRPRFPLEWISATTHTVSLLLFSPFDLVNGETRSMQENDTYNHHQNQPKEKWGRQSILVNRATGLHPLYLCTTCFKAATGGEHYVASSRFFVTCAFFQ